MAILGGLLSLLSTSALAVGAWFFRRLVDATDNLRREIGRLRESIAADTVERAQHRQAIAENKAEIKSLTDRLQTLSDRIHSMEVQRG